MTFEYDWRCQACDAVVKADEEKCTNCGCPADARLEEIEAHKVAYKVAKTAEFKCIKCGHKSFEAGEIRAAGGVLSALFDIQTKRFYHVSCAKCGYTELYRKDLSAGSKVIDFLIGR